MTRTHDLLITNQLLYRLSYTSMAGFTRKPKHYNKPTRNCQQLLPADIAGPKGGDGADGPCFPGMDGTLAPGEWA